MRSQQETEGGELVFDLDAEAAFLLTTNTGSGGVLFFVLCHLEKYQKEAFEAAKYKIHHVSSAICLKLLIIDPSKWF